MDQITDTDLRKKAKELARKLTLEEKIGMIHGAALFETKGVERLGIPPLRMSDGPMGVRQEFEPDNWKPVGLTDDYVTYLPCNSALASTWNRELAGEAGRVLGEEARGRGKDVILGPGINIKRSPLCGRNFEYFSEDPFLTGELAVPLIRGIQEWDVAACVKHFAANNQETERLWVDVEVDEKVLREIYLPAFREAVTKGGSYTIMGAYNRLYGSHCCQSGYLLGAVLRGEWAYDGVVISDWGAVHDTREAACSELDIEMSVTYDFDQYFMAQPLKEMVEQGLVEEARIDRKVVHILMLMQRLHMLDGKRRTGSYNTPKHRQKALEIARESVVLLKNKTSALPLNRTGLKRLLVVGDNAERIHSNGGGSAEIKALYEISPLMGIRMLLGGNTQVRFARGYCQDPGQEESEVSWQESSLEEGAGNAPRQEATAQESPDQDKSARRESAQNLPEDFRERRAALREEAVRLAAEYEHVIFIGGLNHEQDCEGRDRADMKLPYEQDDLIRELLEVNPSTVVVMTGGSPVEMGEWIDKADSVVWSWYAGMEGGRALAEVLFGEVNPSGKLPETFYKRHTDCSAHILGDFPEEKTAGYREGLFVGYRYNETFHVQPQFCFGHGLSYTEFAYSDPCLESAGEDVKVTCEVRNTGTRPGKETIQVYVAPLSRDADQPSRELKGFEKIALAPGEKKRVTILLEGGCRGRKVYIGSSIQDIRLVCGGV